MTLFSVPKFTGFGLNLALTGYFLVGNTNAAAQDDMKEPETPAADAEATFKPQQKIGKNYTCLDIKRGGAKGSGGLVVRTTLLTGAEPVGEDHKCPSGKTCRICYGTGKDLEKVPKWMMKKDDTMPHSDLGEVLVAKGLQVFERLYKATNDIANRVPYGADMTTERIGGDVYILSKWIDKGMIHVPDGQKIEFKEMYEYCYESDGYKEKVGRTARKLKKAHFMHQDLLTKFMQDKRKLGNGSRLKNMMPGKWVRLFFGDYSVHPLNEMVVSVNDNPHIIQFDYGAGHDNTRGLFGDEIEPDAKRWNSSFMSYNKNFFKIIDPYEILSLESIKVLECLSGLNPDGSPNRFIEEMERHFDELARSFGTCDENHKEILKNFLIRLDLQQYAKSKGKDEMYLLEISKARYDGLDAFDWEKMMTAVKRKYISRLRARQASANRLMKEIIRFRYYVLEKTHFEDQYHHYLGDDQQNADITGCKLKPFMDKYFPMPEDFTCEKSKGQNRFRKVQMKFIQEGNVVYIQWTKRGLGGKKKVEVTALNKKSWRSHKCNHGEYKISVGTVEGDYTLKLDRKTYISILQYFSKNPIGTVERRRLVTMHKLLQNIKKTH